MTIRVGLLGLNHGERVHLPAYRANPAFEVTTVCARTPGRAEAVARAHHVPRWTSEPRQLISSPEVDLVSIATPSATHAGLAAKALAAGKHVVVEVGFAPGLVEAQVLAELAQEHQRVGAAALVLRYVPLLRVVADLLAAGSLGQPRLMRMDLLSAAVSQAGPEWRWMRDQALGGGMLANFVAHGFDLACQWLGRPLSVEATLATLAPVALPAGRQLADDTGNVVLHFESGALAVFTFSGAVAHTCTLVELHGSAGSLLLDGFGQQLSLLLMGDRAPRPVYAPTEYLEATRGETGLLGGFQYFLDRLALAIGGQPPPDLPTFAEGVRNMRLVEAAVQAAREHRRVALDWPG